MANVTDTPANPFVRIGVDMGPLIAFFGTYFLAGYFVETDPLMAATAVLMVATVIALSVGYVVEKRFAPMPLITGVILLVLGGLTLALNDKQFVLMKPTFVNVFFASVLTAGLLAGRNWMQFLFKDVFNLTDEGWAKLTWRWIGLFLFLAVLNEIVWRNFSEAFWVNFKVFGVLPLTIAFTVLQVPFITKHSINASPAGEPSESAEEPSPPQ